MWHHIKQTLSVSVTALLLVLSLAAALALSQGSKFLSVQSGSMVPTFQRGDLVIVKSVPDYGYKVGDIITFINPKNAKQTITHRVDSILPRTNMQPERFVTKGDANPVADMPSYGKNVIGKVHAHVPYLGFVFDFTRKPIGLILLIYIPALTVIVAEMKRLVKYYKDQEPYVVAGFDPKNPMTVSNGAHSQTKQVAKASALAVIAVTTVSVPVVHAALASTATLTGNTISTALPANNLLIYKVSFTSGSTSSTGTSNSTNISVTNNNLQSATSGNATSTGGNATSGSATNSSTSNTSFNVTYGSGSGTSTGSTQTVTMYNPGNQAVNLAGWKLTDDVTTQTISSGSVAAKTYFTYTWPIAGGLNVLGDRLSLRNPSAADLDGLSWGSDTSQLNPAISTSNTTISLTRKTPTLDTNTASDWQ
jgi:signal peptidase